MKHGAIIFLAAALSWAPPALPDGIPADVMNCLTTFGQLKQSGFIRDQDLAGPVPVFIVDESQWRRMEFRLKAKMGALAKCLVGALPGWRETEFRSHLTNRLLGKLENGELNESE